MKHINQVVFFENYGLWALATKEARINKMPINDYIVTCVEKVTGQPANYSEELYHICETEGEKQGLSVAGFMEWCCLRCIDPHKSTEKREEKIPEKKLGIFELPKG